MCVRACQCPACSSPFVTRKKLREDEPFSVSVDPQARVATIQGKRYSFELFDHFASGDDRLFRIVSRADEAVTIQLVEDGDVR